jgi:signal transduction histidine kinase
MSLLTTSRGLLPRGHVPFDRDHLDASIFGPPAPTARERLASPLILLVEDDLGIRDALQAILEGECYEVVCAGNGQDALRLLRSGSDPDLIILDLRLPVMDGWQFRAVQKSDPALADIPVLAVSADGSAKAAAIDAEAYFRKPLDVDSLLEGIDRVLTRLGRRRVRPPTDAGRPESAVGHLAATVGHEINNPLTYLMVQIDLMAKDLERIAARTGGGEVPVKRAELDRLRSQVRDCGVGLHTIRHVVRNLQSFCRPARLEREALSLNDVLDTAIALSKYRTEHRARIIRSFGDLPPVAGDLSGLGQVFLNLILNAADTIAEGRVEENAIEVRSFARACEAVVEVSDTGPFIPRHALSHLFEPFFTTGSWREGTGLGLPVSWRIVADHGGHIEAFNNADRGATFRVVLPMSTSMSMSTGSGAGGASQPEVVEIASEARGRVLVIDDERQTSSSIESALAGEYEVTAVSRVREAFARLAAGEAFDLILCDLPPEDESSHALFERLLSESPQAARRITFMIRGPLTADVAALVVRASGRVLSKPLDADEVRALVRAQVGDPGLRLN